MTEQSELKPCTSCGSGTHVSQDEIFDYYYHKHKTRYYISCNNCVIRSGDYSSEEDAVEEWNSSDRTEYDALRADSKRLSERVEVLKKTHECWASEFEKELTKYMLMLIKDFDLMDAQDMSEGLSGEAIYEAIRVEIENIKHTLEAETNRADNLQTNATFMSDRCAALEAESKRLRYALEQVVAYHRGVIDYDPVLDNLMYFVEKALAATKEVECRSWWRIINKGTEPCLVVWRCLG